MWKGDRFNYWYINLESPLERTPIGVDFTDNILDIRIWPDLDGWEWKDEDHLERGVRLGLYTADAAARTRREGEAVVGRVEDGLYPFDATWVHWRPEPGWGLPALPDDWSILESGL